MISNETFEYARKLRRQLHQYPEIGFDLTRTLALVHGELDAMGIPYTGEFGRSSVVATVNPECKGFTIGIRADMDALPINEVSDKPYASKNPGAMHACGHDAHTAMLLAVAKELKPIEKSLRCRVKLLFTPAEEYIEPGCKELAQNGVMDDIDCCISCHVLPTLEVGKISTISGGRNANSMGLTIEFFGVSSHAASQQSGRDAISMAVEAYSAMEIMVAKEISAVEPRLFNIGTIHGGETNNVICNYCKMFATVRTHSDEVMELMQRRITEICQGIAAIHGGQAKITVNKLLPFVYNDPTVTEKLRQSAKNAVGEEMLQYQTVRGLGGEDFGFLSRKKPSMQFNLGTRGADPNTAKALHNDHFDIDEAGMKNGISVFVQFVLDHQDGIDFV